MIRAKGFSFGVALIVLGASLRAQDPKCFNPWRAEQRAARANLGPVYRCPGEADPVSIQGFEFRWAKGGIEISSRDRSGRQWSMVSPSHACHEIWVRDFDRNGQLDALVSGYSGAAGIRPETVHYFVLRDSLGQPIPWRVYTYGLFEDEGRTDLLDLNKDGRLEVLVASYGNSDVDEYNYWTYELYEARNGLWHLVQGQHGPVSYPVYSKFTFRCHNGAASFPEGKEPQQDNHANEQFASSPVTIRRIEPEPRPRANYSTSPARKGEGNATYYARLAFETAPKMVFSDGRRCAVAWTVDVLHSRGGVRSWFEPPTTPGEKLEDAPLVREAQSKQWPVRVATSVEKGYCFVRHLWIEQP